MSLIYGARGEDVNGLLHKLRDHCVYPTRSKFDGVYGNRGLAGVLAIKRFLFLQGIDAAELKYGPFADPAVPHVDALVASSDPDPIMKYFYTDKLVQIPTKEEMDLLGMPLFNYLQNTYAGKKPWQILYEFCQIETEGQESTDGVVSYGCDPVVTDIADLASPWITSWGWGLTQLTIRQDTVPPKDFWKKGVNRNNWPLWVVDTRIHLDTALEFLSQKFRRQECNQKPCSYTDRFNCAKCIKVRGASFEDLFDNETLCSWIRACGGWAGWGSSGKWARTRSSKTYNGITTRREYLL